MSCKRGWFVSAVDMLRKRVFMSAICAEKECGSYLQLDYVVGEV